MACLALCLPARGVADETGRVQNRARILSGPPADRPFALAFVSDSRLLAVTAHDVRLLRVEGATASVVSRLPLPGPLRAVRAPAALVSLDPTASTAWVLTNGIEKACLVDLTGDSLTVRAQAEAFPWPSSPSGLRYREGTNWLEGEVDGIGGGPFLTVVRVEGSLAVSPEGRLLAAGGATSSDSSDLAVGPTLAPLWPGFIAASTPDPPGSEDAVVVLERRDSGFAELGRVPVEGAIRALASRSVPGGAVVAAAADTRDGYDLWRLQVESRR